MTEGGMISLIHKNTYHQYIFSPVKKVGISSRFLGKWVSLIYPGYHVVNIP